SQDSHDRREQGDYHDAHLSPSPDAAWGRPFSLPYSKKSNPPCDSIASGFHSEDMSAEAPNISPTPFEVANDQVGSVRVLSVSGELDRGTAPQLEQPLEEALASDGSLLIDLSACEFIDSTGIALLVRAWQRLDGDPASGGESRFALCGLGDQ